MKELRCKEELKEGRFLLAFSGGPDSVYLLYRLALLYKNELNKRVSLCYINYHDSPYVNEEEKIVYYYVNKYNLTIYKDDTKFTGEINHNFEEWAREYRYHLFAEIIKRENLDALLTAHQKTDHVETYILQKRRNNLPYHYGLKEKNNLNGLCILRPLLNISKRELINELNQNELPFYDDITNKDTKKDRNRLRVELSEDMIDSYLDQIDTENSELDKLYVLFNSNHTGMDFITYNSLSDDSKKRYCFYLLDKFNIKEGREGIGKRMFDFLNGNGYSSFELANQYKLYRTNNSFFVSTDFETLSYSYTIKSKEKISTPFFDIDLSDSALFLVKSFPITIRNFHKGDRIASNLPIKDVETLLKKQGVPSIYFPLYPILSANDKIFCVPFYTDIKKGKLPIKLKYLKGIL